MSGNFMRCSNGVNDPFQVQEGMCEMPGDVLAEKRLLSPEGRTSWIFWSCGWSLSSGDMHVLLPPELSKQCQSSRRVDIRICGVPTRLSHRAFTRANVL